MGWAGATRGWPPVDALPGWTMNELRRDPTTGNWVIIAPGRGRRPESFRREKRPVKEGAVCPFCPGHEADTPPDRWRLDGEGGWRVRVVNNKFPALEGDSPARRLAVEQGFVAMSGAGHHEVVVESPRHDWDMATASDTEVRDVLEAYRTRYRALRGSGAAVIVVFRNHGAGAGTSLAHPHSQIVAAPVVPLQIRHRFDVARQHFDDLGGCLYMEQLGLELASGRRLVLVGERFVSYQPFAASYPFETWIVPRFQQTSFGDADDGALDALAPALRRVLSGLRRLLDDPDYNLVIHSAPPGEEERQYFLWHIQIVPRLTTPAGFELGSGIPVNASSPEETAVMLREAVALDPSQKVRTVERIR
jgi:UDPglucose--hexose-1-phosphate uridylyltransferase